MPTLKPHLLLPLLLTLPSPTTANTEKVIFTAPPPITLETFFSAASPALNSLPVLGPSTSWSLRTNLTRVFANEREEDGQQQQQRGYPSWLLLEDLTPGQRYEVRVCWSALEPTEFTLDTYPLNTILSTPHLLQSLSQPHAATSPLSASSTQQPHHHHHHHHHHLQQSPPNETSSILLLRVLAAADYFSHYQSLMKDPPPPVLVDLILDPYVYNALPQSLVPTVCYLVVVGIASWFVARWAARSLAAIADSEDKEKKQN